MSPLGSLTMDPFSQYRLQILAPIITRILVLLHLVHAPRRARLVRDMTTVNNQAFILLVQVTPSSLTPVRGHALVNEMSHHFILVHHLTDHTFSTI